MVENAKGRIEMKKKVLGKVKCVSGERGKGGTSGCGHCFTVRDGFLFSSLILDLFKLLRFCFVEL